MNDRLESLSSQLESLHIPSNDPNHILHMAKATGSILSMIATTHDILGSEAAGSETEMLRTVKGTLAQFAFKLGPDHPSVEILSRMYLICKAIIENRPEPTDAELDARINQLRTGVMDSEGLGGQTPEKSNCFIATAACGTDQAPDVIRLRLFRDNYLRLHWMGRCFILVYETMSPPIACIVDRSPQARAFVRVTIVRPARRIAERFLRDL